MTSSPKTGCRYQTDSSGRNPLTSTACRPSIRSRCSWTSSIPYRARACCSSIPTESSPSVEAPSGGVFAFSRPSAAISVSDSPSEIPEGDVLSRLPEMRNEHLILRFRRSGANPFGFEIASRAVVFLKSRFPPDDESGAVPEPGYFRAGGDSIARFLKGQGAGLSRDRFQRGADLEGQVEARITGLPDAIRCSHAVPPHEVKSPCIRGIKSRDVDWKPRLQHLPDLIFTRKSKDTPQDTR